MPVKLIAIPLFLSALTPAIAQQLTPNEMPIQYGFVTLRTNAQILLELSGTDRLGSRTNNILGDAYFLLQPGSTSATPTVKEEIDDYVNGGHGHRIVGDGTTVWGYNYLRNDYTSFLYGSYSGAQPANSKDSMLQEVVRNSEGSSVFLARAMTEVYGGDFAEYRTWFPGANTTVVTGGGSMVDPITNVTYQSVPAGGDEFVVYTYPSRLQRSAAFHLTQDPITQVWSLTDIYYGDFQRINASTTRLVQWKMTVYTGSLPSSTNYVFVPPKNARPIANVKGQGSG